MIIALGIYLIRGMLYFECLVESFRFSVHKQKTLCIQFSILNRGCLQNLRRYLCMVYNKKRDMYVIVFLRAYDQQLKSERMTKNCLKVSSIFKLYSKQSSVLFKISP